MLTLFLILRDSFRTRLVLQAEILALRHQLLVLRRAGRGRRLPLCWADHVLWVWLSQLWNDWRSALLVVKPETVIAWHRKGFRLYWKWKSRRRQGRPTVCPEVRNLIRQMSLVNPRWGVPRIHGELLKIGIEVSQATVAKYLVRHRNPRPQTWRTFPKNHAKDLVSVDLRVESPAAIRFPGCHPTAAKKGHVLLRGMMLALGARESAAILNGRTLDSQLRRDTVIIDSRFGGLSEIQSSRSCSRLRTAGA